MRISDWSSDVCSSDLHHPRADSGRDPRRSGARDRREARGDEVTLRLILLCLIGALALPLAAQDRLPPAPYAYQQLKDPAQEARAKALMRSEERRVGKECVRTCRYRWSRDH